MANNNRRSALTKALSFVDLKHISGPRGSSYYNYVKHFQRDILGAFTRVYREYGHIASFPWPMNSVIIYSPQFMKQVLVDFSKQFIKGEQIEELRAVVGNGLATNNNHESWIKSRSLLSRTFGKPAVSAFSKTFDELSKKQIANWEPNKEFDICEEMKSLTFDIACKTLLGAELTKEEAKIIHEGVGFTSIVTYERIFRFFPLPYWVPTRENIKFNQHFDKMNAVVMKIIQEEKEHPHSFEAGSILQKLVNAKDPETGHSFSDDELRDEAFTMMLAGHETSAHTLAWTLGLLAKHQNIQVKLREEILQSTEQEIPYLKAVLQEAMRLYPAFPVLSRKAAQNVKIGDYSIPKGTNVVIPIYVMQRSEEFWNSPLEFRPERFLDDSSEKNFNHLPFSRGPRRCIAEGFAMVEMSIVVANILKKFKLKLKNNDLPTEVASVSLKPQGGMWVVASPLL